MVDAFLPPLTKQVRVPRSLDETFRLFTDEMAAWWPLATHSVGGDEAVDVQVEGRVGGGSSRPPRTARRTPGGR